MIAGANGKPLRLAPGTRHAAKLRAAVSPILGLPNLLVALVYFGGGSPVAPLLAVPAIYLLWVAGADVVALIRRPASYAPRPRYLWFVGASALVLVLFFGWRLVASN